MLHVALYQPEIPPNTGNIIRLCANTNSCLHLIYPLGFHLDEKSLRRAGLDYHEWTAIYHYSQAVDFFDQHQNRRIFACTTKASTYYHNQTYQQNDIFLFGPESRGLPEDIRKHYPGIKIPMAINSRSLNLSNSVAIILYEGLRQLEFNTF